MPSNTVLTADIETAAKEKGVEVPNTEGLNNKELAGVLKDLNALEAEAEAPSDKAEAEAPSDEDVKVAPGKSLIGKRGMLAPGAVVTAKDLDDKAVAKFLKSGHLVK